MENILEMTTVVYPKKKGNNKTNKRKVKAKRKKKMK